MDFNTDTSSSQENITDQPSATQLVAGGQSSPQGYYVSEGVAKSYIVNQKKVAFFGASAIMAFVWSVAPNMAAHFLHSSYFVGVEIVLLALTVVLLVLRGYFRRRSHKVLERVPLVFEGDYLERLRGEYAIKKIYYTLLFYGSLALSILSYYFMMKLLFTNSIYALVAPLGIGVGAFGFSYISKVIDAYELLTNNGGLLARIRRKMKNLLRKP